MPVRQLDPAALTPDATYRLLTQLVVPRPIAWVSTLGVDGTRNVAPHSYYNIVSHDPPVVHFTSSGDPARPKDTLTNVRAGGEFVVNVVTRDLAEAMNLTAADFPPGEDEFAWAGLEAAASTVVAPPRVAAAKAALECRLHTELTIGSATMVFGEVVWAHVDEQVWVGDDVDPGRLGALGRLGGTAYTAVEAPFHLDRPSWQTLRAEHGARRTGKD